MLYLEQIKIAASIFAQISTEKREKTFKIEKQQYILFLNKGAAKIFKDYVKGKNINYEEFNCVTLDEMQDCFYMDLRRP